MRILIANIIAFLLINFSLIDYCGKYEYRNSRIQESIELLKNQTFIYKYQQEFLNYTIKGNYNIVDNNLVLDSSPQKDKIIVLEQLNGKFENKTFNVTDKKGNFIIFHLYVTLNDNSQKIFKDCFKKVKFKSENIKSFHIVNTSGIKSPEYRIEGKNTNTFTIQLETIRVFDNENWEVDNYKIKPKGVDGKIQDYYLTKN